MKESNRVSWGDVRGFNILNPKSGEVMLALVQNMLVVPASRIKPMNQQRNQNQSIPGRGKTDIKQTPGTTQQPPS
jgi:hypothetical protein